MTTEHINPDNKMTLFTIGLALFMDVLDSNILNTSIPSMAHSLHVEVIDIKIALISYLISLAVFIPSSGWCADRFGAKNVFISAFILFTVSSFFCGLSNSLPSLVIGRCFQGMGGAYMITVGRLIINRAYERHESVKAMNTVVTVVSTAVMLGPTIGGLITEHFSWPWIFWVNLPVGIVTIVMALIYIKDNERHVTGKFDICGFLLFGGGLAILCFSLSALSESNIHTFTVYWGIVIGILFLVAYYFHALSVANPIVSLQLLKLRTFRVSVFGNIIARLGFAGMPFLLPLLQQIVLGYSAKESGLLIAPIAIGIIIAKSTSFQLLHYTGYRRFLLINTLLLSCSIELYHYLYLSMGIYSIITCNLIFGIFSSAQYTAMSSLAFANIENKVLSNATTILSTVTMIAQSFGVAIAALLLRIFAEGHADHLHYSVTVFHYSFTILGALTMLSTIIFLQLHPKDGDELLPLRTQEIKNSA